MSEDGSARDRSGGGVSGVVRRAFVEFLDLPAVIIAVFVVLAVGMHVLDEARISWLEPVREVLHDGAVQLAVHGA